MNCRILVLLIISLISPHVLAEGEQTQLFESHTVLNLTMPVDFDALCRPSQTPDCDYTATEFIYLDSEGREQSVPISIRRRDGWRAMQTNCQVPTLFVRFNPETTVGTPFEGQSELALTSHCGKGISPENIASPTLPSDFERYVINEYLGYRIYNLISDMSLGVRLVRMHYTNPEDGRGNFTRDAFFSEHFEALAERFNSQLLPPGSFDPATLDWRAAEKIALFQYMVGNTDWSIEEQENIVLFRTPSGKDVPVVFDLDMSGLVNAHYAAPSRSAPISNVKQRYFMGYCHPDTNWDDLFTRFSELEVPVITMLIETPGLGRGDRRVSGSYLDSFFEILDSEEARETKIVEACRPMPAATE